MTKRNGIQTKLLSLDKRRYYKNDTSTGKCLRDANGNSVRIVDFFLHLL